MNPGKPLPRRKPLTRRGGLTSTTGIVGRRKGTPAAPARAERDDVPVATRELLRARSRGRCEALVPGVCTHHASDAHHRQRRRDGGHGIGNLVDLCRACHRWAHANPARARELGLIVSAFEVDPAAVPVLLLSHLTGERTEVLLEADGSYLVDGLRIGVNGTLDLIVAAARLGMDR